MITYNRAVYGVHNEAVYVNTTAYHHNNQALGFNIRQNTFQERMILCMRYYKLNCRTLWKALNAYKAKFGYVYDPSADETVNTNVSYSYALINDYYHGVCVPKTSRLRFMAKFFGVSEYWLEGSGNLDAELIGRSGADPDGDNRVPAAVAITYDASRLLRMINAA